MESHMLCLKHRKSLKGRKPKKNNFFAECQKQYSAKKSLSRVSKKNTWNSLPSVKKNTRQIAKFFFVRHSAKMPSPVVRSQLNNPIAQYRSKMVWWEPEPAH